MAPESIRFRLYSQKSDAYAFGTLLWEMWSSCEHPFMLVADYEEVARRVIAGKRLERPQNCPDAVFKLMEQCWKQIAAERPTFADLKMDVQDAYAAEIVAQAAQERLEESLCVVCLERQADYALLPCGHKCVCEEDAAVTCRQGRSTCPVCCTQVHMHQRIW
jgi:hypothetical protein